MSSELPIGGGKGMFPQANLVGQPKLNSQASVRQGFNQNRVPNLNQALVPVQKITQVQMEDRHRRGLCYLCDSKWTHGHVCTVPKLFLIEAVQKEEEEEGNSVAPVEEDSGEFFLEEFPEISLNAIIGTPSPKTMRIVGVIRFHRVIFLINLGSTHNFLDTTLATSLGIQPQPQDGITVQIANGQEWPVPGAAKRWRLNYKGLFFGRICSSCHLSGAMPFWAYNGSELSDPFSGTFMPSPCNFHWEGYHALYKGLQQGPRVNLEGGDSFKLPKLEQKGLLLLLVGHPLPEAQGNKETQAQILGLKIQKQPHIPGPVTGVLN